MSMADTLAIQSWMAGNISAPLQSVQIDDDTWQSEVYEEGSSAWGSGAAMEALTLYEVVERYSPISVSNSSNSELIYLKVWPKTGRRHQIRVHLASLGRPLLGDLTYGHGYGRGKGALVERLFLHCRAVQFLDLQGQLLRVEAPVPWELAQVLERLEKDGDGSNSELRIRHIIYMIDHDGTWVWTKKGDNIWSLERDA